LRLVDKQGKLIDDDGKHIDEWGNYIKWIDDDNYIFVDDKGREVKDGKFNTEFSPFVDDETGQLFDEDGNVIEEEKPKPKRKRRTTKKKVEASAEEEKQEETPEPEKQDEEPAEVSS